ncbi:MAG: phosphosulfolactate synthase [Bacteroidota bacterium]
MNISLPHLPQRCKQPRSNGITMVMDKGMSIRQLEDFIEASSEYVDFVKLGFGTSVITKNLNKKIKLLKGANLKPYFGGTLFETFVIRGMFDEYVSFVDKHHIEVIEVSDGEIKINHDKKCEYIHKLSKNYTVISEVGSKEEDVIIHPNMWIKMMNKELEAGSWKVIAESRESGTVGIYHNSGNTHTLLVKKIIANVNSEKIIWEAPKKSQQAWWIKLLGANVNLGNIAPEEVIPLETLRLGLRGDTFFTFLPKELSRKI